MAFLATYDAAAPADRPQLVRQALRGDIGAFFAELRAERPIFPSPIGVFVTRHPDVVEVLSRAETFKVAPYAAKMMRVAGSFILNQDEGPDRERDLALLHLAMPQTDLPRVQELVRAAATEALEAKRAARSLDVVEEFTRLVPLRFVQRYLGVPGTSDADLLRWGRTIFADLFTNLADDPAVREPALQSGQELRAHLEALLAAPAPYDSTTVLGRLRTMRDAEGQPLDAERIRVNITGVLVGAVETTSKVCAQALDYLLDDPALLAQAQGVVTADDPEGLRALLWEAIRFRPQAPFLLRLCAAETTIAAGTPREARIPAQVPVYACVQSAMHDAEVLDEPERFVVGRPAHHYLHFGTGMHRCLGFHVNQVQLPEVMRALLLLPGLRRAAGEPGRLSYAGPFPIHMQVEFD